MQGFQSVSHQQAGSLVKFVVLLKNYWYLHVAFSSSSCFLLLFSCWFHLQFQFEKQNHRIKYNNKSPERVHLFRSAFPKWLVLSRNNAPAAANTSFGKSTWNGSAFTVRNKTQPRGGARAVRIARPARLGRLVTPTRRGNVGILPQAQSILSCLRRRAKK